MQPVTISWVAVAGAHHYRLELSTASDLSTLVLSVDNITQTSFNLPDLIAGTPYFWRVRAVSAGGVDGVWSPVWAFTTQPIDLPPTAPTLLAPANQATDVSVTPALSWTSVLGATSYRVQVGTDETLTQPLTYTDFVNSTVLDMPILQPATTYYWRVSGVNLAGQGPWSAIWSFTTLDPSQALTPPVLTSPANGAPSVQRPVALGWQLVPSATRYEVQIAESNTFGVLIFSKNDISASTYTVQGLQANKQYYWRVRAVNDYNASGWSAVWNFITAPSLTAPPAPVLKTPKSGAAGVQRPVHFEWYASTNAERYELQISPYGYFPYVLYSNNNILTPTLDVSGLTTNKTYFWRVRAINATGISPWSTIWCFTTGSDVYYPPSEAPTLIYPAHSAVDVNLMPTLSWSAVNRATTYLVQFGRSDEFSIAPTRNTTYTYLRLADLAPNTEYYWRVRAYNSGGYGPWSTVFSFRTGLLPGQPILTAPVNGATGVAQPVQLAWIPGASTRPLTYTVDVSTTDDFASLVVHREGITTSNFTLPALADGRYYWRVRSTSELGNSVWSVTWSFWTNTPPPAKPETLQASLNIATGIMGLTWTPVTGWTTYEVQHNVDGAGWQTLSSTVIVPSYNYVPPGGTHTVQYRVRGVTALETTAWSDPAMVTYTLNGIWIYAYFENEPADPNYLVLQWNSVPNATLYDIQFQGQPPFTTWTGLGSVDGLTTEYRFLPFISGETEFRVRSYNPATGYSTWSNPYTINIPAE
ncbi:MAG: fibronectin type III domain-containing protein [Armatimonadota bacterium]